MMTSAWLTPLTAKQLSVSLVIISTNIITPIPSGMAIPCAYYERTSKQPINATCAIYTGNFPSRRANYIKRICTPMKNMLRRYLAILLRTFSGTVY